jgi:hypothetical protein
MTLKISTFVHNGGAGSSGTSGHGIIPSVRHSQPFNIQHKKHAFVGQRSFMTTPTTGPTHIAFLGPGKGAV